MLFAGRAHSDRLAWASMPKLLPWKNCDVFREAPRITAAAYPKRPACFRLTEPPAPRLWLEHAIALGIRSAAIAAGYRGAAFSGKLLANALRCRPNAQCISAESLLMASIEFHCEHCA